MNGPDDDGDATWRAATSDDAEAIAALLEASEVVDRTGEHFSAEDVRDDFMNDLVDNARDTRVAEGRGRIVAFGVVQGQSAIRGAHRVWCYGTVHPELRRRGIGATLLTWQLDRGAELHSEKHPTAPAALGIDVGEHQDGARALAEKLGLAPERRWFEMARSLDGDLPDAAVPAGIAVEPFEWVRDDDVRRGHNDAFDGHFGSTERTPEEWKAVFTGSRSFRPDLSIIATDTDGRLAGYALGYVYAADVEASGRRQVWLGQIGTLHHARGTGVGRALLANALHVWRAGGLEDAHLGVDTENASGALALYERAGFSVANSSTTWSRHLDPAPV